MPLYNRPVSATDLLTVDDFMVVTDDEEPEVIKPSFGEQVGAAMALTPTGALQNMLRRPSRPTDPGFEIDWQRIPRRYDAFKDALEDAGSEQELFDRMSTIDRELKTYDTLHKGGWTGWTVGLGAQLLDPVTLPLWFYTVPKATQAYRSAGIAGKAGIAAGLGVADAAVSEAILMPSLMTRDIEDAAVSLAAAGLFAGTLGGTHGLIASRMGADKVAAASDEVTEYVGQTFSAYRRPKEESGSIGAGQATTTFAQEQPLPTPMGNKYVSQGAGKPLSLLPSPQARLLWNPYSVTARRAVDELVPHNVLKQKHLEGIPGPMPVATEIDQGMNASVQALQRIRKARADISKRGLNLSEDEIAERVGKAMRRGDKSEIPEIQALARADRQVYEAVTERAVQLGILDREAITKSLSKRAQSYFPRYWNLDAITANPKRFRTIIGNHLKATDPKLTDGEIEQVVGEIIDTIGGTPTGQLIRAGGFGDVVSGRFKAVSIDVADVLLEEFLISDSRYVLRSFLQSTLPEVILKERYGVDNVVMQRGNVRVSQIDEGIKNDYQLEMQRLTDEGKSTKAAFDSQKEALLDVGHILETLAGLSDPKRMIGAATSNNIRSWMAAATLGNIPLASMSDVANPILQHGLRNFFKSVPAMMPGKVTKVIKEDFDALGIGMDIYNSSRMMRIADIDDVPTSKLKFGAGSRPLKSMAKDAVSGPVWADRVFKYTLANRWNHAWKRATGISAQNRIIADALKGGKLSKARQAKLASIGLDANDLKDIAKEYRKYGDTVRGAHIANHADWENRALAHKLNMILHREAETTVVTPQAGAVPRLLDNSIFKFVTQFKVTALNMQLNTLAPLYQRMMMSDMDALAAFVVMVSMGTAQESIRGMIRNNWDRDSYSREVAQMSKADWVKAGIERSGAAGFLTEGWNLLDFTTEGQMSGLMNMSESSRWYFRQQGLGSFVPASDFIWKGLQIPWKPFTEEGFSQADLNTLRRLLPFQNAYYSKQLFDWSADKVADALDLPEGKKQRKRRYAKAKVKF